MDLMRVWRFVNRMKSADVYIITDIDRDIQLGEIEPSHADVDISILALWSEIRSRGKYIPYEDNQQLCRFMEVCAENTKQLFFYYSGHMDENKLLLLPDNWKIDMNFVFSTIDRFLPIRGSVVMVWDCCHGQCDFIPFEFNGKCLAYNHASVLKFYTHRFLIFCPSQLSFTTIHGSTLTRELFAMFDKGTTCLKSIFASIENLKIYATYPDINLPIWIYEEVNKDVCVDTKTGLIVVRKY